MGIAILLVMAVGVRVMLTRKVPTAFVLVLLSVVIGLMAGAPLMGDEDRITTTVLQEGAVALAATMAAIVIGSWLGSIMGDGVRVERVMLQTLPYTWVMAVAGLVLTAVRFL